MKKPVGKSQMDRTVKEKPRLYTGGQTVGTSLRITLLAVVCALATGLHADTLFVTSTDDSGPGTLREALANAVAGDTVDATGITGTILLTSGELVIGKSLTLRGPGPANLTINANSATRVFFVGGAGHVVVIEGLTITGGATPAASGAGILHGLGTLTVSNCLVTGNAAVSGGGIATFLGTLRVIASTISDNSADSFGGGIFNGVSGPSTEESKVEIIGSTITNNAAVSGGGIYNFGGSSSPATLVVVNSTLSQNSADVQGGGIFSDGASLTVENCVFNLNSALGGGGIVSNLGTVNVTTCTFSENFAADGGGAIAAGGSAESRNVTSTTFDRNSAVTFGGAILLGSGPMDVMNSTFVGNTAEAGGGIEAFGDMNVANCTFSGNTAAVEEVA
jgi:predicted outer membrane repeat protein